MGNTIWKNLRIGNVVMWNDSLWVVEKTTSTGVDLIPAEHENMSAHPTMDWPADENKRVDSIVYVARHIKEYIETRLIKHTFPELQ